MKKGMPRERKKKVAQAEKLRPFLNVDMCACCTLMKCEGPCREAHTNDTGVVKCFELYQIDPALIILKDKRRGRRVDKTDTQEHSDEKRRRRDKIQRRKRSE